MKKTTTHPFARPSNHGTITEPTREAVIAVARRFGLDDPGHLGEHWTQLGIAGDLGDHLGRLSRGDNVVARRFSELFDGPPEKTLETISLALGRGIRIYVGDLDQEVTGQLSVLRTILSAVSGDNTRLRAENEGLLAEVVKTKAENASIEGRVIARVAGEVADLLTKMRALQNIRSVALRSGAEARAEIHSRDKQKAAGPAPTQPQREDGSLVGLPSSLFPSERQMLVNSAPVVPPRKVHGNTGRTPSRPFPKMSPSTSS